uniref:Glycine--tRNA ligase n=1 Tax=Steinernema glaseri TaxID=37863 RepID=A0A1I7XZL0_9BILA
MFRILSRIPSVCFEATRVLSLSASAAIKVTPPDLSQRFSKKRRHKRSDLLRIMATPEIEKQLEPLRLAVKEYGDKIRALKEQGASKNEIAPLVVELKARKKRLEDRELELAPIDEGFQRERLEDLLKRRFFYDQSFAIYGGVTGLYDFGPMGCSMKKNMLDLWRRHFVLEDEMLEVECSALTPEPVLKASGHVERFADWMVKDVEKGDCHRADHLIKDFCEKQLQDAKTSEETRAGLTDVLAKLEGFDNKDMWAVIQKYNIKSPTTGNDLSEPVAFNMMFATQIGPTGDMKAFLRPETAQGIFLNFKRLLEFNQGKLPFAAAQIGSGFRNEISPRQGLIRVREFTMCEIEHFVDPAHKDYPKFEEVKDVELMLLSACNQMDGKGAEKMAVGAAVSAGIIDNETLGYFMARTHLYLIRVGIDPQKLRFRQHLANEMAHYAKDCWDAECLTSYGWIECVGNADRSCFDLEQHTKATKVKLVAEKKLPEPKMVSVVEAMPNKAAIGKAYKADAKKIIAALEELTTAQVEELDKIVTSGGTYSLEVEGFEKPLEFTSSLVSVKRYEKKVHVEEVVPSVIEPSFGIGRIMYSVLEHSFRMRDGDEKRTFLALKPTVAPINCALLPISSNARLEPIVARVKRELTKNGISCKLDDSSGSIGRRYARTDEIGIPFGITVDFESEAEPQTVTLRHSESMKQIRLEISELADLVQKLSNETMTWADAQKKYPAFETKESE